MEFNTYNKLTNHVQGTHQPECTLGDGTIVKRNLEDGKFHCEKGNGCKRSCRYPRDFQVHWEDFHAGGKQIKRGFLFPLNYLKFLFLVVHLIHLDLLASKHFDCKQCTSSFPTRSKLLNHIKVNHQKTTTLCDGTIIHKNPAATKNAWSCPACPTKCTTAGDLQTHYKSCITPRDPNASYLCDKCLKVFNTKNKLKSHFQSEHQISSAMCDGSVVVKVDGRWPCGGCGKSYTQPGNLQAHYRKECGGKGKFKKKRKRLM